ncbi:hypothetical protein SASPL_141462 [Salvia splendens]|uniref:LOV domain-containing protein n=1 Tax=Salvia splendens TaxID=180675 RepID=A0A8X8ZDG0_SALSN|nr:hypothetical protein SASPL_141462 [Salvia splendens]
MESQLGLDDTSFDLRYSVWAREALNEFPDCFTITDPCAPGHPIVFASNEFLKMVGYSREEVVGRNGRMFQGPDTDRRSVMVIREAIREERGVQISLLNYRKDGTPFWMLFQMCPVFSKEDDRVIHFLGVQVPLSRRLRLSRLRLRSEFEDGVGVRDTVFRCCRREVCSDPILERGCASSAEPVSSLDDREDEMNEPCEANELEKAKASTAINNILSVLTHYSEHTGRLLPPFLGDMLLNRTDALLPDMPIAYASYARHEVLGRNCRFLSGTHTDTTTQFEIKECIQNQQACTVRILNYRKDRTSFWNFLHISPVRNASGKVAFFVGIQIDDRCKNDERHRLSPEMRQLSVVGAVKVAVRGLSMGASTS